ncbi:MAG: hypothetical protein M1536_04670 [Firmicutes bacterium]|nr:hypothetical protein [Bacillota bacterium]
MITSLAENFTGEIILLTFSSWLFESPLKSFTFERNSILSSLSPPYFPLGDMTTASSPSFII